MGKDIEMIIYKRTSTGAIQQWEQEINGPKYRTISGQVGGKLVTSEWTVCTGKNIGKSNETTPKQQAILEVKANYKKKLEQKGYHTSIDDIDNETFFKPMLAKEYDGSIEFPIHSQPKLDGIRCIVSKKGMFTRNGKNIVSCPHIYKALAPLFKENPNLVLDGELYNHELKHEFNTIVSLAKKTKPTQEDLDESERLIQYHVYDMYDAVSEFSIRSFMLRELLPENESIVKVNTQKCLNEKQLDALYESYLYAGYEGQMLRLDKPYENKRSGNLLKRKPSNSDEFELVDIKPGVGNYDGIAKIATLKMSDGRLFGAGIAGSQDRNRQILIDKDKYIGNKTTVEYIGLTPDGIPRFGRVKEFNRSDNG